MLTESQKRALRAKAMLDMGGISPKQVARECGYTNVNGMLGAIMMCDGLREEQSPSPTKAVMQAVSREEHAKKHTVQEEQIPVSAKAKIYPVESGKIIIRKADVAISYRPESRIGPTVHISDEAGERNSGHPRWLTLVGKDVGGKPAIVRILRQISEAALECADLIEDELRGGKRDVDHHA